MEAIRQIVSIQPSARIIALTMYREEQFMLSAIRAGARGYLLKEAAGDEVARAVRAVHAGGQYLSALIAEKLADMKLLEEAAADPLERLSTREREVLQFVVEGKSSVQIAQLLALSPKTVETYRSRVMHKLGISDLPSLIKFAIQEGL